MERKYIARVLCAVLAISVLGCSIADSGNSTTIKADLLSIESKTEQFSVQECNSSYQAPGNNSSSVTVESENEEMIIVTAEYDDSELSPSQLNSLNMLNYMTVLTQQINESNGDQVFLESARTTLYSDTNLNAVDTKTQAQITQLVSTIDKYRMIDVKRKRLEYINERRRAQAMRQAMPSPVALLSVVQSGSLLKAAVSVLYMTVDSVSSYNAAINQAELEYLQEGWSLDDEEQTELNNSTTAQFNYMCNIVREYDLPDEYVVRDADIKNFVSWTAKTNLTSKITWLEKNKKTFEKFRPYWLELVKDYYEAEDYENCLDAIAQYERISTKIIRKDLDYANALPMVIIAAKESLSKKDYVKTAKEYCELIRENTKDADWSLRYFVAQIYLDLYSLTKENEYLESAYDIALYNTNTLVDEQRKLNQAYLADIKKEKASKSATKREKAEVKQYNKLLDDERKIALPPVSEALYLNCDLLFSLAEELNKGESEMKRIDRILHEKGENLFLTEALDNKYRYNSTISIDTKDIDIDFDGTNIKIPATLITEQSKIEVIINSGNNTTVLEDWTVSNVDRKKSNKCSDFIVKYNSAVGKKYKYKAGDSITINVTPIAEDADEIITFNYDVVGKKVAFVIDEIKFERK